MKYFSKLMCMAISLLMLFALMLPVSAQDMPEDGLYTISVASSSDKFVIEACILRVQNGNMTATMTMSGTGYGYLFPGTGVQADAVGEASWIPYRIAENGKHQFTIPVKALDQDMDLAAYSIRKSKWYDRTVSFQSSSMKPYKQLAPDGIYSAQLTSDTLEDASCILTVKDGQMHAQITWNATTAEITLDSLDVLTTVDFSGEQHRLAVESSSLRPVSLLPIDGTYQITAESDSPLFSVDRAELLVSKGELTAKLTVKSAKYSQLFCGSAADALSSVEEERIPIDDADTYVIPVAALDQKIPLATYDGEKNRWYDRTLILHSDSLIDENGQPAQLEMLLPQQELPSQPEGSEPADISQPSPEKTTSEPDPVSAPVSSEPASASPLIWLFLAVVLLGAVAVFIIRRKHKETNQ